MLSLRTFEELLEPVLARKRTPVQVPYIALELVLGKRVLQVQ